MFEKKKLLNLSVQILLPVLTIGAQVALAFKLPNWSLIINMTAQPFWIYSAWKAYKNANQIGLLINSIFFTLITAWGIVNYWVIR